MADGRTGIEGMTFSLRRQYEMEVYNDDDYYMGYGDEKRVESTPYLHHLIFSDDERTLTVKLHMPEDSSPHDDVPKKKTHHRLPLPEMHSFPLPGETIADDLDEYLPFLDVMKVVFGLGVTLTSGEYKDFVAASAKNFVAIRGTPKKKGGHVKAPPRSEVEEYYAKLHARLVNEARNSVYDDTKMKDFSLFVGKVYAYAHVGRLYPPEDPSRKHG